MAAAGGGEQSAGMSASPFPPQRLPPFGVAAGAALVCGVSACLWLPALPPWPVSAAALACGLLHWWQGPRLRWLGPLLAGFGWVGLHAAWALASQLPPAREGREATVSGRIVGLPEPEARRTRFRLRVDGDAGQPEPLRGRLLQLAWYDDFGATAPGPRTQLQAGARWRLTVRLRAPRGLRNPGGFDAERHALAQRIAATGHVRDAAAARWLAPPSGIDAWRERMSARIAAALTPPEAASRSFPPPSAGTGPPAVPAAGAPARAPASSARFVQALALGDTRGLDDRDWEILRAVGLTHLVAISGFHVGMVAGGFGLAAMGAWWLLPALGRRWPRPQAVAVTAVLAAVGYAAAAGFSLPTVRTVLMIAAVALARLWRRPVRVADTLALAAVAVLAFDPLAVLAAGFWLSFAGVAWLAWCLPQAPQPLLRGFLAAQWVATLGLLPLSAVLFLQASLAGPAANLAAIPWWSLVVVPLALLGTGLEAVAAGAGAWAWRAAAWCFDPSWTAFVRLAEGRFALRWLAEPAWYALPLACLGAFWCLLPRGVPGKPLAGLLWLPLLWPDRAPPAPGEAVLTMFDVGQGLSVLVRTHRHALLYDAGPAVRDGFDAGERAVVPALRALGVPRLQRAVVSHADADHAGGFEAVWRAVPVRELALPAGAPALPGFAAAAADADGIGAMSRAAAAARTGPVADARWGVARTHAPPPRRDCLAGQGWDWDGVRFRFLHPTPHFPYLGNEASCVLRVETAHGAALLTGDIGGVIERELVRRAPEDVRAEALFAPHHGSAGSSDPMLVAASAARHVLVSTGHGNRFGHPRPEVVARWRAAGAEVLDTAHSGAVEIRLVRDGVRLREWRRVRPRPWDAERRLRAAAILSGDG